jgi:deoxyribonuclease I
MKFSMLTLLLVSLSVFAQVDQKVSGDRWAYYGEGFYQAALSGKIEKASINQILNGSHSTSEGKFDVISGNCQGSCYEHVSVGYDNARKFLFGEIYILRDGQGTYVHDVYCGKDFHFRDVSDASDMHADVNIEHTWAQSKFSPKYPKGTQKSDMHHLFLTDSRANSQRGNLDFADLTGVKNELNVQNCPESALGRSENGMTFMPPAAHRGNLARALFYFSSHYDMDIKASVEKTLRKWHAADPVDASEKARHEIIARIQKSRNPFIDHPEMVEKVTDF